jgi:hypothetical protein
MEIGEDKFKQIVAERFRPANKPNRCRKVLSFKMNGIWVGDLVNFQDQTMTKDNDGCKIHFVCVGFVFTVCVRSSDGLLG